MGLGTHPFWEWAEVYLKLKSMVNGAVERLPFFICALRFEKMCDRIILLPVKFFPYWLENQYIQTAKEKL